MPKNVGTLDRIIRFLAAAAFAVFGFLNLSTGLWWVGLIGLIPLVTGLISWCPIWHLTGVRTVKVEKL